MSKRTSLNEGQLYKLTHENLGVWYFTSILKASAYCDINYSYMYMLCNGMKRSAKGWICEIINDSSNISKDKIDPQINSI